MTGDPMTTFTRNGDPLPYGPFTAGEVNYPANVLDVWTDDELAAIGVARVAPAEPTLDDLKAVQLEALAARRRQATSMVSVGGMVIPWDDTTENRVANGVKALEMKPEGTAVSWEVTRGVFVTLDLQTLRAIGLAAFDLQQAAFDNVRDLTALILAAADETALDAIDIEIGWP